MQVEKKFFCHWDLVRFLREEDLKDENGDFLTVSVSTMTDELMIFLGRNDSNSMYEVRVYKAYPDDRYVPYEYDYVSSYEENDEYATFFFKEYKWARHFVEFLGYVHAEYRERPMRRIEF